MHFETKKLQRGYWDHFLLATYWGTWPALKSSCFPQWDSHEEKWMFLCTQLATGLEIGACAYFSFQVLEPT